MSHFWFKAVRAQSLVSLVLTFLLLFGAGGRTLASDLASDSEEENPKKLSGISLASMPSKGSVKEKVQIFQNLAAFSNTQDTSGKKNKASLQKDKKSFSSRDVEGVGKGSKLFLRSKPSLNLTASFGKQEDASSTLNKSSTIAQSPSPKSPRFVQRIKKSFSDLQSSRQGARQGKASRVKNQDKDDREGVEVSSPSINTVLTKQHTFTLESIEQELQQKVTEFDMVEATIKCHLERLPHKKPTIDPMDEKYLYVLKGDLKQLGDMHVKAMSYLNGKETLKKYDTPEKKKRIQEEIASHIKSMGDLLKEVAKQIFWVTGTGKLTLDEIALFEKKLADAKKQLQGGSGIEISASTPRITHPVKRSPGSAIEGKVISSPVIRSRAHTEGATSSTKINLP